MRRSVLSLTLSICLTGCGVDRAGNTTNQVDPEIAFRAKVEQAVREQLKDPDSAKFEDNTTVVPDRSIACGKVNARNGFGGYNGMSGFMYDNGNITFESDIGTVHYMKFFTKCIDAHQEELKAEMEAIQQRHQSNAL